MQADPSPIVELNRAVAVGMRDGPDKALVLIDAILARGELADYQFAHSARGSLLERLGLHHEASAAYATALTLARQEPEKKFLRSKLQKLAIQLRTETAIHREERGGFAKEREEQR